ncbi:hypothetical protein ACIOWG_27665 [Streptomyces sp. NPDC087658]|uniref:hypothetical protein n=1 Tax=Streptomyces sp. NPDC087658 TaxID=3365800 RepID=UPI00381B03C2
MSEPNPYADGEYKWGPAQPPGTPPQPSGAPEYDFPTPPLADGPAQGYAYPQGPPGYGYPQIGTPYAPMPVSGGGAPLLSLGDISVIGDAIITPSGTLPLRGAVWNATDMSRTEEKIPTVAIVLAVVFALLCLVGLLFLLMKEKKTTGFIQVMVTSGGKHHSTLIPAHHPGAFPMVMGQINYARSLSSM